MKRKVVLGLILIMLVSTSVYGASIILTVNADHDGAKVYIDGVIKGVISDGDLETALKIEEGEHLLVIKKNLDDGSYYYFKKKVHWYDGNMPDVDADLERIYTEEYYYKKADDLGGYNDYLEEYPNGKHTQEIKRLKEEYYYKKADGLEGYKDYLEEYPNSKHTQEIKKLKEEYYYKKADNLEDYNNYLNEYPNGKHTQEIRQLKENHYYKKADGLEGYKDYLKKYPDGRYTQKVKELREEYYYKKANDLDGYNNYLEKYPNGKHTFEIKRKKESYYYERADNLEGYNEYLKKYPDGKYATEIRRTKENHYIKQVKENPDSIIRYENYLEACQNGRKKEEYKDKLYELKSNISPPAGFVFVEGGEFKMGSYSCEAVPVHDVKVSSFFIGKYEVTHTEYIEFLNDRSVASNGLYNKHKLISMDTIKYGKEFYFAGSDEADDENCPVINVTWRGAIEYCNWLSEKEGLAKAYNSDGELLDTNGDVTTDVTKVEGYRLPTEAEWEYAARGGNKSKGYKYAGSNNLDEVGWYDDNAGDETHPVGQKKANELGLYDMSGNVYEWCQDGYDAFVYNDHAYMNPYVVNVLDKANSKTVKRGGGWDRDAEFCRIANRSRGFPGLYSDDRGFRVLRRR